MAMTGGKAYLVRHVKADYGNANWYIDLYVYVKESSRDVANNKTTLSLGMYVVTPSGYDIGQWDDWKAASYLGSTSNTFNGTIPNFSGTRWIVENKTLTVTHNADGTKTASIPWYWNVNSPWGQYVYPSGTVSHTVTTIPRATQPTVSAESVNMGSSITISMPRASSAFTHTLKYSMGTVSGTIGSSLGTSTTWTVPYSLADAIPNAKSGTCTITCETYSGTTLIGTKTVAFTANVPDDSNTKPSISCAITPVNTLSGSFANLYIQGITKVKTKITASGKYGASITGYWSFVEGTDTYAGQECTHGVRPKSGSLKVVYTVQDSRGYKNTGTQYITVIPYGKPAVVPISGENEVICKRCEKDGTLSSSGTYLRIKAGRAFSKVESNGQQLNYCLLRYRYKASTASSYGGWQTLLERTNASVHTVDVTLNNIVTSITTSYDVQINVVDDIGNSHTLSFTVPTDKVNFHEREYGDGAAFGKYSEKAKALEVAEDWELLVYGDRWKKLAYSSSVSASATGTIGRSPANDGVYYRVENGNHVYIAFNCAFSFSGSQIVVNSTLIPEEYRPTRGACAMCAAGDGRIAVRVLVNASGQVIIDFVQLLTAGSTTASSAPVWVDGYIDYFITP